MQLQWWIAYVTTILILMSTPGPSQILMLSNSLTHGYRKSLATLAGDLSANLLQMLVAATGLVTLIQASSSFFRVVKWGRRRLPCLPWHQAVSESPTDNEGAAIFRDRTLRPGAVLARIFDFSEQP